MKAIQVHSFGDPEVMQLHDLPDLNPAADQIKIQVKAIGVNPVDAYIRTGTYPLKPDLPYTPGLDAAGVIVSTGKDIKQFKVGDRVYVLKSITGCYAEEVLCTEDQVYSLPDNVDFNAGAALGVPFSTAFYALNFRARAQPGETVLIHGASGAVGSAAIQIAKANGLRVIGTAGTANGIELLKKEGVMAALNHNEDHYLSAINELTDGAGVDVVLEMLANVNLNADLELLAKFGRVVVIGNRGTIEINPRSIMGKNASVLGMTLFNTSTQDLKKIHADIRAGLAAGRYQPVIQSELPLSSAAAAHEMVMKGGVNGKIVLIP